MTLLASSVPRRLQVVAALAALFGVATVVSGGRVLFGPDAARAAAGAYLPFVVWFNFGAGFLYLAAAWGLWRGRRWAYPLALGIALATPWASSPPSACRWRQTCPTSRAPWAR